MIYTPPHAPIDIPAHPAHWAFACRLYGERGCMPNHSGLEAASRLDPSLDGGLSRNSWVRRLASWLERGHLVYAWDGRNGTQVPWCAAILCAPTPLAAVATAPMYGTDAGRALVEWLRVRHINALARDHTCLVGELGVSFADGTARPLWATEPDPLGAAQIIGHILTKELDGDAQHWYILPTGRGDTESPHPTTPPTETTTMTINTITNLDALLIALNSGTITEDNADISNLPTFGGEAIDGQHGDHHVWSWDAQRALVGDDIAEAVIIDRTDLDD